MSQGNFILEKDPVLKKIISELHFLPKAQKRSVFHDLVSCIIEQQIHYRSTKKIFQKLLDKAGIEVLTIKNFSVFEEKGMTEIKLSTAKYETLLRTVEYFSKDQTTWGKIDDLEVRKKLNKIKGVGPWTINMILLYTLERPDIFPADDYHLKKIMTSMYKLDEKSGLKAQMTEISDAWTPFRSEAVKYLLAWKEELRRRVLKK